MQLLAPSQIQIMLKNIEITTEIGNRIFIGIFVKNADAMLFTFLQIGFAAVFSILTVVFFGTPQNIFSTLMAGAYDYLEIAKSSEEYRKKIEDIARWNWYLGKYGLKEK